ncbi:MAG: COG1470 family protein [Candidatus Thorarchaeota archaeon]
MKNKRLILTFLVIISMLFGLVLSPTNYSLNSFSENGNTDSSGLIDSYENDMSTKNAFAISQDTEEGIINPVQIKESGFKETDPVRARTDTGTNTNQNIAIDDDNNWIANYTSVEVSNMRRLYGVNGTFEDGVDPWTTYTIDGGSNIQIADYNPEREYIICRNVGDYKWASQHTWTHSADTEIGWEQTVNNPDGKLNFNMRLDFRYATGPIDPEGDNGFFGDIGVFYQISNGGTLDAWYFPMETNVGSRDAWYSLDHDFTLPAAWSQFEIAVGLWLAYDVTLNNVTDYDDDPLGLPDGTEHAQNLTLYLDNVEFTGIEVPTFENVDLTFHAGVFSEAITGSGVGVASISNPDYWTVDPLEIQITSNTTVVFTYTVTALYLRYTNSSWTTYLSEYGVSYSIEAGQSADLEFYTYVTTSSYENQTIEIEFPVDWENATVWDPLQNDITGLCEISPGSIYVPNSFFDRVGWWKITHQSFNYAKSIDIQIYDTGLWTAGSLFRTGNQTRTQVELGTASVTPDIGSPVTLDWVMPNGTIWASDSVSSNASGFADSTSFILGGTNTSAGLWEVVLFWNNGTEIAYGVATFDLYHQAAAVVQYPTIETDHGLVLSNQIILTDIDSGEYLLDDGVSITANWSDTTVDFSQNFAKNWWQADFDSSLIENGLFTVIVDISRPYFDPITTQFTVISIFETTMDITNAGSLPIENGLNEIFTVQLDYDLLNGTGVSGAMPTVTYTGTQNGLTWQNFIDNNNGQYLLDVMCNTSDIYEVTITLSRPFHYNISDSFTLIIGETGSELELLNGTAAVTLFEDDYRLVLEYRNSTGQGLSGADLQVLSMTPATGLVNGSFTHMYDGFYEVIFTSTSAGTYSIVIGASIVNHETQYTTFTLTVSGIPTILTSIPSTKTVAVNESFTLQLRFWDQYYTPIDSAIISTINAPSGISISNVTPTGNGLYNITLQSSEISTFDLLFRATTINYQSSSTGFTFVVTEIQTELTFEGEVTSTTVEFSNPFELVVYYDRMDTGAPIQGAEITVIPGDILELEVSIIENIGYYVITIRGTDVGSWVLSIVANKTNHRVSTKSFFIEVEEIDTTIQGSSPLETLLIGRFYDFAFNFIFESNSSNIYGATITSSGSAADWATYLELGSGQYSVNLTPQELGEHSVIFTFEKVGFESASFRLSFTVGRIPIMVKVLQGLNGPESSESIVNVQVTEVDTGDPVSGVQVVCHILDSNGVPTQDGSMVLIETDTTGVYSGSIPMPVADGEYQLQISCEAADYVMYVDYTVDLEPARDLVTMLWVTTTRYYPIMIGLFALCVGLVYQRRARKNRIRENKATLAIKHRFDDIKSLMGVIVLHKDSGLPVYSKILRDGLEETVISAFITAITSFRGEFDIESSSEEWGLIPISFVHSSQLEIHHLHKERE